MSRTVLNKRSNIVLEDGSPKIPTADQLDYGEFAINYNAGKETISFKNSNNEIVAFGDEVVIGTSEPSPGSHAEIFIDESVEPITVEIYSKDEIDTMVDTLNQKDSEMVDTLNQKDSELESELDQKVLRGSEDTSTSTDILIDTTESPSVEVYTRQQVDDLFTKLIQLNPTLVWN